jgi:hypothetical protein
VQSSTRLLRVPQELSDTLRGAAQGQRGWLHGWFQFWINLVAPQTSPFAYSTARNRDCGELIAELHGIEQPLALVTHGPLKLT